MKEDPLITLILCIVLRQWKLFGDPEKIIYSFNGNQTTIDLNDLRYKIHILIRIGSYLYYTR